MSAPSASATVSFPAFLQAIKQQESGGNYSAVSPDGALGAYQIMPANIPQWSAQALGAPITVQQFMASPAYQDEIAGYKLKSYFDAYGAAGAASAWYSGSPNNAQDFSPDNADGQSAGNYVQQVLARIDSGASTDSTGTVTWKNNKGVVMTAPPDGTFNMTTDSQGKPEYVPSVTGDAMTDDQGNAIAAWLKSYGAPMNWDLMVAPWQAPYPGGTAGFSTKADVLINTYAQALQGNGLDVGNAIPGLDTPLGGLETIFTWLTTLSNWKRVGMGLLGVAILVGMVAWFQRGNIKKAAVLAAI